ncbi:hypothetical protein LMG33818_001950 [Halomonadaceae bacterium LMG 33818]|uniref:YheV family putative zinc ribbon protein n=1 Tax=Cernens ardua TaxID=3402176 RepID=UPI003EDC3A67
MSATKRFIAGAVCPRCAEMDTLRSWEQEGIRYRECVECDFLEQLPIEEGNSISELVTRVNQPREEENRNTIQTVRIIDPESMKKH